MWFWLSLTALIFWSGSDLFSKIGCQDSSDRYSHLKMVSAVGIVMGLHAGWQILFGGVALTGQVLLTYLPVSLLGIGGALGWALVGGVFAFAAAGIVFNAVSLEKFKVASVLCELGCGWSILLGLPQLLLSMGRAGVGMLALGGALYTVGAVLYGIGAKKRYMHSVFHLFCLAGTWCHFWAVYAYLL